jgi:site-specific recombinase XerD
MLQQLFVRVHFRYTRSAHVRDLEAFATWLHGAGYPARYAQRLVFRVKCSLERFPLPPSSSWSTAQLERAFVPSTRRNAARRKEYREGRARFAAFLSSTGRLIQPASTEPLAELLSAYRHYLSEVAGLAPATVTQHLWEVNTFLRATFPHGGPLARITPPVIDRYVERRARQVGRRSIENTVSQLQAFFRYCFDRRVIPVRHQIDRPSRLSHDRPPRALDWQLIQRFLRSIDRSGPCGWRDFMLLHLMAHYGLRTGEITRLLVDSIDWDGRVLLVEQPKTHGWLKMPLLDETVVLLRRYLQHGRRRCPRRELFLCAKAPDRPLTKFAVSVIFKVHARRSGLPIAHASAYSLRHSFAMRLFGCGVGIKVIGDLMGHNSLRSTTVYLRLQTDVLRDVALSVPSTQCAGGAV